MSIQTPKQDAGKKDRLRAAVRFAPWKDSYHPRECFYDSDEETDAKLTNANAFNISENRPREHIGYAPWKDSCHPHQGFYDSDDEDTALFAFFSSPQAFATESAISGPTSSQTQKSRKCLPRISIEEGTGRRVIGFYNNNTNTPTRTPRVACARCGTSFRTRTIPNANNAAQFLDMCTLCAKHCAETFVKYRGDDKSGYVSKDEDVTDLSLITLTDELEAEGQPEEPLNESRDFVE